MKEEWSSVCGFAGIYMSNKGRILSINQNGVLRNVILAKRVNKKGEPCVKIKGLLYKISDLSKNTMRRLGGFMNFEGMGTYLCDCRKVVHMSDEKAEKQGHCNYCEYRKNNTRREKRDCLAPVDTYKDRVFGMFKLTGEYMAVEGKKCLKYRAICQECGEENWKTLTSFHKLTICKCSRQNSTLSLKVGERRGVYEIVEVLGGNGKGQLLYKWRCSECGSEFDRTPGHFRKDVKCTCNRKGRIHGLTGETVGVYTVLGSEKVKKTHVYVLKCTVCGEIHASTRAKPTYKDRCYCSQKVTRRDYSYIINKFKK